MPYYNTHLYQLIAKTSDAADLAEHNWRIWGLTGGILTEALAVLAPEEMAQNFIRTDKHTPLNY